MTPKTIDHSALCFVFGSNLAGAHIKGAALTAKRFYGAQDGVGEGPTGQCYALPTKDERIRSRPIHDIQVSVCRFLDLAANQPDKQFMVTRIGCGLAGYRDGDILRLFTKEPLPENVLLPGAWLRILNPELPPKIIIAGGRTFTDYSLLQEKVRHLLSDIPQGTIEIVSGKARGADALGAQFCNESAQADPGRWQLTFFPANWNRFDKPAGMLRNHAMAWYATHLIAFWDGRSAGTKNMIDIGAREQLNLRVIRY